MAQIRTRSNKERLFITIPMGYRNHIKAKAALEGMTVSDWVFGLILDELETDEDARIAMERLSSRENLVPWEDVRKEKEALEQKRALRR